MEYILKSEIYRRAILTPALPTISSSSAFNVRGPHITQAWDVRHPRWHGSDGCPQQHSVVSCTNSTTFNGSRYTRLCQGSSMNSWLTWGYWYMFLLLKELLQPDGLPAPTHPLGRGVFNETPSTNYKHDDCLGSAGRVDCSGSGESIIEGEPKVNPSPKKITDCYVTGLENFREKMKCKRTKSNIVHVTKIHCLLQNKKPQTKVGSVGPEPITCWPRTTFTHRKYFHQIVKVLNTTPMLCFLLNSVIFRHNELIL